MAKKLPKKGKNKLPTRRKLPKRKKPKSATSAPQSKKKRTGSTSRATAATRKPAARIKFTKTAVAKLASPASGKRDVYRDTQTPHLCLRVTPTAKTFYWEKTVRGRQERVTIGKFPDINVEQARAIAADISADYVKGVNVADERRSQRSEATFGDLWADYRENRPRRKPGTYSRTLDEQWERVLSRWESRKLSQLTYSTVFRFISDMRKRAPIYANRIQRHGHAMYEYARRSPGWRYKGENPFAFDYVSERGRARRSRLTPENMPAFMRGLEACSESMRLLFLTSLYTGRRIGEVQAMRWGDLDLADFTWNLPDTKTGESQVAMIPEQLNRMLIKRAAEIKGEWVFPSASKSGHVEEIKKAWARVRESSGLHDLQARDLRRTMASWAQDIGVPMAIMQAQLGHADISTTAKHYTAIVKHVQLGALEKAVDSMIQASRKKVTMG